MQAITTKYYGPGNVRGSRVKASCERGSLTVPWRHELDSAANHTEAARALLLKFAREDVKQYGGTVEDHHWGEIVSGEIKSGVTVHVVLGRHSPWANLRKAAENLEAALWDCSGVEAARRNVVEALAEVGR